IITAAFGGDKIQKLEKAVSPGGTTAECFEVPCGPGRLWYCPLPMELADIEAQTVTPLYNSAAIDLGMLPEGYPYPGTIIRPVVFAESILYLLSNETSWSFAARKTPLGFAVPPETAACGFVDRTTGKVLASYPGRAAGQKRKESDKNAKETKPTTSN